MTIALLKQILKENNIPDDVHLMSDSGWECDATEMDGVMYNKQENTIVFAQGGYIHRRYEGDEWVILYDPEYYRLRREGYIK